MVFPRGYMLLRGYITPAHLYRSFAWLYTFSAWLYHFAWLYNFRVLCRGYLVDLSVYMVFSGYMTLYESGGRNKLISLFSKNVPYSKIKLK